MLDLLFFPLFHEHEHFHHFLDDLTKSVRVLHLDRCLGLRADIPQDRGQPKHEALLFVGLAKVHFELKDFEQNVFEKAFVLQITQGGD